MNPRRPQASPLYRVLADHFETLERVHEVRFEPTHGPLRSAARRDARARRATPRARAISWPENLGTSCP